MTAPRLLVLAPLRIEARAAHRGAPAATILRTGMGSRRARAAAERARGIEADAVVVVGFCGALDPALRPGDLVVASELRPPTGSPIPLPDEGAPLAAALEREGLQARRGPVACAERLVRGRARARLAGVAVDMESAWLAAAGVDRPFAVLRAVVDTPDRELLAPLATLRGGMRAYRSLARAACALPTWAATVSTTEEVPCPSP